MRNQSSVHFYGNEVSENTRKRIAMFEEQLRGLNDQLLEIPEDFTEEETKVYLDMVESILATKAIQIGNLDVVFLRQLAFDIVQVNINRKLLREEGSVVTMINSKGKPIVTKNPRHQVLLDLNKEIKGLFGSLGLDLSSRNKLAREIDSKMFDDDEIDIFD